MNDTKAEGELSLDTKTDKDNYSPIILLSGGGTGGHITPILALAHELKKQLKTCKTIYVGERGSKFISLTRDHVAIDQAYSIFSGKYRRYYGEHWLKRLLDPPTLFLNIRDLLLVVIGIFQALFLLGKAKPDIVFLKGGFVGVPIGLAAALRHIPIVTHDSDSLPGLANRMVSRWASLHATAMPEDTYAYPRAKTKQVGVLVEHSYQYVDKALQDSYRQQLELPKDSRVVLVTGGSSGASAINRAIKQIAIKLLNKYPDLMIVHQVGRGKMKDMTDVSHDRLKIIEFLTPMHTYMGAADVVVTRASGNTLAELGIQAKPAIVIPSPFLADGHQLRNAEYLKEQGAAVVVTEDTLPDGLEKAVAELLENREQARTISTNLQRLSFPNATVQLASLILEQTKKS